MIKSLVYENVSGTTLFINIFINIVDPLGDLDSGTFATITAHGQHVSIIGSLKVLLIYSEYSLYMQPCSCCFVQRPLASSVV